MQRLKQHNSGAALPLGENELLSVSTVQTLPSGGWCHVRMRLAIDGEAERSVHFHDDQTHSMFHHECIVLQSAAVAELCAAVRSAFGERESVPGGTRMSRRPSCGPSCFGKATPRRGLLSSSITAASRSAPPLRSKLLGDCLPGSSPGLVPVKGRSQISSGSPARATGALARPPEISTGPSKARLATSLRALRVLPPSWHTSGQLADQRPPRP